MSLFSSIQLANNALNAAQIGLQVVGQNIANVNTPGYSRAEVQLTPAPTQRLGSVLLGLGVQIGGVTQKIDHFLEDRLRNATSDRTSSETQEQAYLQLESILGELSDTDLSTSLTSFFGSINDIINQPESLAARNLAILKGQTLASDIQRLAARVTTVRNDANNRIGAMSNDINRLLVAVRDLNLRIVSVEGGGSSSSDAIGLRDQRNLALTELSKLIDIRVQEQESGAVSVINGGDFLVFEGIVREVTTVTVEEAGLLKASVRLADSDSPLVSSGGELSGLVASRDQILGGFLDSLDSFASTLAYEFNRLFSSGQGMHGYSTVTSQPPVSATNRALDDAGLFVAPSSGSFKIQVFNKQTQLTETTTIQIDLNGLDDNDTTLNSLAAAINAVNGVSASVSLANRLTIVTNSDNLEIGFADDTSGVLASLGLNTFFTGGSARELGVNAAIISDPAKFAASLTGIGSGTGNALNFAAFLDRPLGSAQGASISELYDNLAAGVTQGSAVAQAITTGFRSFEQSLQGQSMAISGVSIDEEAVRMISFQRAFQASAKYIATLNELLGILVNL